jgi:hypothetical protein
MKAWERIPVKASAARRVMFACLVTVLAAAGVSAAAQAAGSPPHNFRWFTAKPAPSTWKVGVLPAGAGILFYPRNYTRVGNDRDGISVGRLGRHGTTVDFLNATPKQSSSERLSDWPTYRLHIVGLESDLLHEDAHAIGLHFVGGKGSCVIDDYRSHVVPHHYREIACLVQGHNSASVVVAATLASNWARAAATLERAVEAYQVT